MKNYIFFLTLFSALVMTISVQACGNSDGPKPINYGKDQCVHCKMTISDPRFGCQLITKKGRVYNFDDALCIVDYVKAGQLSREDVANYYLPDYSNNNNLLPVENVYLLKSERLRSPMRGDVAAFANEADLKKAHEALGGEIITWEDLWK